MKGGREKEEQTEKYGGRAKGKRGEKRREEKRGTRGELRIRVIEKRELE